MSNRDREDLRDAQQDAALERAWREGSTEQPPARLDAGILAAARKAVRDRTEIPAAAPARGSLLQRWSQWAPMAAAAVIAGLAFTLVQILPRDPQQVPTPAAQESAPAAPPAVTASPAARMPGAIPAESTLGATAAASQAPPVGSNESRADFNATRSKAVDAAVADEVGVTDEWVERIMTLHAAGDTAAAADALRAFRAAVPDADSHLPESLSEWAARVR